MERILRAIFRKYQLITGLVAEIKYVMADADRAQRNAMSAVVKGELAAATEPTYLMCFFHVMANVKKYIAGMSTSSRELVFKHLYRWHYARSPSDLRHREMEAMEAWNSRPDCKEFVRKFSKQWTEGPFTAWHCLASPLGFAKSNNPVEQFNKQVKRDYTLRTRINVNMLAQELINLTKHQSARAKPFEIQPRSASAQASRLVREDRLHVTSVYRTCVSFMLGDDERRIVHVLQRGRDTARPKLRAHAVMAEEAVVAEKLIETYHQPASGWMVDVDESTCSCRAWFKFASCVHVIAARVHVDLHVEGVTKKRKFAIKNGGGHEGKKIGHALSIA